MGSGNGHEYHPGDGRCIYCDVDTRTGVNTICPSILDARQGDVQPPTVASAPTGGESFSFADTLDYDDFIASIDNGEEADDHDIEWWDEVPEWLRSPR